MANDLNDLPTTSSEEAILDSMHKFLDLHLIRTLHAAQQRHTVARVRNIHRLDRAATPFKHYALFLKKGISGEIGFERRPSGPELRNLKIQVPYLVSLRSQKAIFFLPQ